MYLGVGNLETNKLWVLFWGFIVWGGWVGGELVRYFLYFLMNKVFRFLVFKVKYGRMF